MLRGNSSCNPRSLLRAAPLAAFAGDMDRIVDGIFDNFLTPLAERTGGSFVKPALNPALNVHETETKYIVQLEVPGLRDEDLDISFQENELIISGEKKEDFERTEGTKNYIGRTYGQFKRVIPLGDIIDPDKIEANLNNGVLSIALPKREEEQQKVRKIAVRKE